MYGELHGCLIVQDGRALAEFMLDGNATLSCRSASATDAVTGSSMSAKMPQVIVANVALGAL